VTTVGWKNSSRGPIDRGKDTPHRSGTLSHRLRTSDLQKATAELQTKLGPSSSLHEHPNVPALKAAVLEVERLIDGLSGFPGSPAIKTKEQIKDDWKLGWDGIVKEPVRTRKVQRPKLTLDEEDLLYP